MCLSTGGQQLAKRWPRTAALLVRCTLCMPDMRHALVRGRRVMILVKAGAPVDATIDSLIPLLENGDIIIDGGNEWCVRAS